MATTQQLSGGLATTQQLSSQIQIWRSLALAQLVITLSIYYYSLSLQIVYNLTLVVTYIIIMVVSC